MSADIISLKKHCRPKEINAIVPRTPAPGELENLHVLQALERAIIAHIETKGWEETADVLIEAANMLIVCKPASSG